MRRIAVLTTGRQDWGILRSSTLQLRDDGRFDLRLFVGGMHCADAYGRTERQVTEDGFVAAERLDWIDADDAGSQAGRALAMTAAALRRQQPEALLLVGDRFETLAAAAAATLERVPLVHVHGGEETAGAIDNAFRHAITKLSHLHLVSHPEHAARVRAMGESEETIHVVGAPGLDNLHRHDLPDRADLENHLGITLEPPVVLVTLHPATLADDIGLEREASAVARAMNAVEATYVITLPNNDPGHATPRAALIEAARGSRRVAVEALGDRRYWALLRLADAILGNSSSALIEAPAIHLPAVNVGDRQGGRLRGANVIDVRGDSAEEVADALQRSLDPAMRASLTGTSSPYGDGRSALRIVEILADWDPPRPPRKVAIDVAVGVP
jgi:UDP-hydrolysing UDP-N-acetyl-D-glucosamine 2-epimerase